MSRVIRTGVNSVPDAVTQWKLTKADWKQLEQILGHEIPEEARKELEKLCRDWMYVAAGLGDTAPLGEVHRIIDRAKSATARFIKYGRTGSWAKNPDQKSAAEDLVDTYVQIYMAVEEQNIDLIVDDMVFDPPLPDEMMAELRKRHIGIRPHRTMAGVVAKGMHNALTALPRLFEDNGMVNKSDHDDRLLKFIRAWAKVNGLPYEVKTSLEDELPLASFAHALVNKFPRNDRFYQPKKATTMAKRMTEINPE